MRASQLSPGGALAEWLFASGYRFFLPYLALYLGAWFFDLPVEALKRGFLVLHACNLPLLVVFILGRRRTFRTREVLFWLALGLAFLLPGAYLEYPSDAWEHIRRLFSWLHLTAIAQHDSATWKFAYFWGYSLLYWVPVLDRRIALDFYSAFWQLLTAFQIYALARRLGFDTTWSKLQVVGFVVLFGEGPLGFRYLALSSTPLAYVAFLRALVCTIDCLDRKDRRAWWEVPVLFGLALANHRQEGIFILMGMTALLLPAWYQSLAPEMRRRVASVGWILLALSLAGGVLARAVVPELYPPDLAWQISPLGSFRIWQRWYFMDTYGVHGAVSLVFAVALWRRNPRLALLTLTPALVLVLPPTALLVLYVLRDNGGAPVLGRILLGFPTSFMLIQGLRDSCAWILRNSPAPAARRRVLVATAVLLIAFAASPRYPWAGRLYFAFYRPDPNLSLRFVDQTADWFMRNRSLGPDCRILSDAATEFALQALLGYAPSMTPYFDRLRPPRATSMVRTQAALLELVHTRSICGILIGIRDELPPVPPAGVTDFYRAWDHRFAVPDWLTSDGFRSAAESLRELGWTRTRVPPWYFLYEPPPAKQPTA